MSTWILKLAIPQLGNTLSWEWSPPGIPDAKVGDELIVVLTNPPYPDFKDLTLNLSWAAVAGNPNPPVVGWSGTLTPSEIRWTGFLLNPAVLNDPSGGEYVFRVTVTVYPHSGSPATYEVDPKMIVKP